MAQSVKASKVSVPRSLRAFADQHGARTPEEAMRRACQALLAQAGEVTPPIGVRRLLANCNAHMVERQIGTAGRLELVQGRFVVIVSANAGWRRNRFTVAHEIGHILLLQSLAHSPTDLEDLRAPETWEYAERLCNLAAAELLIPIDDFRAFVERSGLSPDGLRSLYDRYFTSYAALFIRFTEAFRPSAIVLWRCHARHAGEGRTLRVVRCFGDSGGLWLPEGLPAKCLSRNIVAEAVLRKVASTPSLVIRSGARRRSFVARAISAPRLRRPESRSLPSFHGYVVPDEQGLQFDVALFLSRANQACAAQESCAKLLHLSPHVPPQR